MDLKKLIESDLDQARKGLCYAREHRETARANNQLGVIGECERLLSIIKTTSNKADPADHKSVAADTHIRRNHAV